MTPSIDELLAGLELVDLRVSPMSGGDTTRSWRVVLTDGAEVLVKAGDRYPGMMRAEAAGLAWLAEGGMAVPEVVAVSDDALAISWVAATGASAGAARNFGTDLARLHDHHEEAFGLPPADLPSGVDHGWMGMLPMAYGAFPDWGDFYLEARVLPTAAEAAQRGALSRADRDLVERGCRQLIAGDLVGHVRPSRIHGDLWSGNVLWQSGGVVVIDPAAHAGHSEADLAMLALFGAPHFADIVAGYETVTSLAPGWRARVGLHQVYPLLVHAVLFGGGYGSQTAGAITGALRAARNEH